MTDVTTLDVALDLLDMMPGLHLFPVEGKSSPKLKDYLRKASNDPAQIRRWHAYWTKKLGHEPNWGIAPGLSGLVFVDIDSAKGKVGEKTYAGLACQYDWPETWEVRTPSGGRHLWYRGPHIFEIGSANTDHHHIDFAQYVILPGCAGYDVLEARPIAAAPAWFADITKQKRKAREAAKREPLIEVDQEHNVEDARRLAGEWEVQPEGNFSDNTTFKLACQFRDLGLSQEMAEQVMVEDYGPRTDGFDNEWLAEKVRSAYQSASGEWGGATAQADFANDPVPVDEIDAAIARDTGKTVEEVRAKNKQTAQARKDSGLLVMAMELYDNESTEFIWDGRLARGMHTLLVGHTMGGKSHIMYDTAATISRGGPWPKPETGNAPKGSVILMSAEDHTLQTIRPRLDAAGADMTKIKVVKGTTSSDGKGARKFNLLADLPKLRALAKSLGDVVMIGVDPIASYIGGKVDTHNDAELRDALDPISELAEDLNCAFLSIAHFNKNTSITRAIDRIMGGVAFSAAPRIVMGVYPDPDDIEADSVYTQARLLLHLKTSFKQPPKGLRYHLRSATVFDKKGKKIDTSRVEWSGQTDLSVEQASKDQNSDSGAALNEAAAFARNSLKEGPVLAKDFKDHYEAEGIASATMNRAKKQLGIKSFKPSGSAVWYWRLPEQSEEMEEASQ